LRGEAVKLTKRNLDALLVDAIRDDRRLPVHLWHSSLRERVAPATATRRTAEHGFREVSRPM
jgi:hypothetical protein